MSKAKQNTFLTGYFAALAVGAIGLGYLAWSASSGANEAAEKYKETRDRLDTLRNAKIFPKQVNVDAKKKQVDGFSEEVAKLNTALREYQQPLEAMDVPAFQNKLQVMRDGLQNEAKNANVILPDGFDLGMGSYLSALPEKEAVPRLNAWLEGMNFVVHTLISKGVSQLDFLKRPELAFEKKGASEEKEKAKAVAAAAAAKGKSSSTSSSSTPAKKSATKAEPAAPIREDEVLERYPMQITFTGSSRSVNDVLTALSNTTPGSSPFFFDIRLMRIENEQKEGANVSAKVEVKEETDPLTQKPFKRDSIYLFGVEKVTVFLSLDLVRFPEPAVAETKK